MGWSFLGTEDVQYSASYMISLNKLNISEIVFLATSKTIPNQFRKNNFGGGAGNHSNDFQVRVIIRSTEFST